MKIDVHALMRSGHHYILNQLYINLPKPRAFMNNMALDGIEPSYICLDDFQIKRKNKNRAYKYKNIIRNFEHKQIKNDFYDNHNFIPDATVVILRDPFNWTASASNFNLSPSTNQELWINHAMEFTGKTNHLPNKFVFSYNKCVKNKNIMMDKIRKILDTDNVILTGEGSGSSFDDNRYNKRYMNLPPDVIRNIMKNNRIMDLTEEIFGRALIDEVDDYVYGK